MLFRYCINHVIYLFFLFQKNKKQKIEEEDKIKINQKASSLWKIVSSDLTLNSRYRAIDLYRRSLSQYVLGLETPN